MIEDFLELMTLLLELGLNFANERVKTSFIDVQTSLKLSDEQRRRSCVRKNRFDDIVILNNHRLRSMTRRLTAIDKAFEHRELIEDFLFSRMLIVARCHC